MAELGPWIFLLTGSALVLLGFAAAQVFDRFRFPDYFILMCVGMIVGSVVIPYAIASGIISQTDDPRIPLQNSVAPILSAVAISFILFEGGLVLHVRGLGKVWGIAGGHTIVAMALSIAGVVAVATALLGLQVGTALVLALAFCGPSASIDISMLSQLKVSDKARFTIVVEGVMGNVVAAVFVLFFIQVSGLSTDSTALLTYFLYLGATLLLAYAVGVGWTRVVGSKPRRFSFMTSVAIAVLLYAVGEGLLGGNGGIASFVFGLVLGHRRSLAVVNASPSGQPGPRGLQEFHGELVFLLRSFFFLYLGIRVTFAGTLEALELAVIGAVAFVVVFIASRWPSTFALARLWRLPKTDSRILRATVSRGMTDTVLILFAIEVAYIPATEADFVTTLLFSVIIAAALASALMIFRAELLGKRAPAPEVVPGRPAPAATVPLRSGLPKDLEISLSEFLEDPLVRKGEID